MQISFLLMLFFSVFFVSPLVTRDQRDQRDQRDRKENRYGMQELICQTRYTRDANIVVTLVVENLHPVCDIETLPDGRVLVLCLGGVVLQLPIPIDNRVTYSYPYRENVYYTDKDVYFERSSKGILEGVFDMTVDPDFLKNKYVYVLYSKKERKQISIQLSRFTDIGVTWTDEVFLYNIPISGKMENLGARVLIGYDGKIYITLGDQENPDKAQNLHTLAGKTIRLNKDGTVPINNPFRYKADARTEIYTFGHRNPVGLAMHPITKQLYIFEAGASGYDRVEGGDELNLLIKGHNYGWPIIYQDKKRKGMEVPLVQFTPSNIPGDMIIYDGTMFPQWQGDLFVANNRGPVYHVKMQDGKVIGYTDLGIIMGSALAVDVDGSILVGTTGRGLVGWGWEPSYWADHTEYKIFRISTN